MRFAYGFTKTGMPTVAIAQPPTILVAPPPPAAPGPPPATTPDPPPEPTSEAIPVSDPRHPQHAAWLADQRSEAPPSSSPLKWVAIGGGVLALLGGVFLMTRKPRAP